MGGLQLVHFLSYLLCLLEQVQGVGPEAQVPVPLGERQCLVGGPVLLWNLPVFEGQCEFFLVETQHHIVKLVIF